MKRSLVLKNILAILLILVVGLTAVGCEFIDNIKDKIVGDSDDVDDGSGDGSVDDGTVVDKTALNAEIALAIAEQGDYTADSYNEYAARLAEARALSDNAEATQAAVDRATADLSAARAALTVRPVEPVKGAITALELASGEIREITIADYVNVNGLSKITYEVKSSNPAAELSAVADGKFTVTAGEVSGEATHKISINVYYDGVARLTVELSVKITNEVAPTAKSEELVKEYDKADLGSVSSLVIDFAENVNNVCNLPLVYSASCGDEALTLNGSRYTVAIGDCTEEMAYTTFTVKVSYVANGVEGSFEYTYKLGLRDTGKYGVVNGGFEDGLDGWTVITDSGYEHPFGDIDDRNTFWNEGYPMHSVGKYFSAYIGESNYEAAQGTLASSYFIVKSEYATYMLGGAGNHNVYITIENKDGEVLALYRNTEFKNFPEGEFTLEERRGMVGDTVFLANFVTYKVSLADFEGQEVRFVIHDHASEGWGIVFFDELRTYYAPTDALPENAVLAENLLADKADLNALISGAITEQGDYTLDSYNAYLAKLAEARALVDDIAVTQDTVDRAVLALEGARLALVVRPVLEVEGATKAFRMVSGNVVEITLADFVNTNGLSSITYAVVSGELVTVSAITDGKFTVTAGEVSELTDETVTIVVSYNGEEKLRVALSVQITNDSAPTLIDDEITREYDVYELESKDGITVDLSENADNAGNLVLSYSVAGAPVSGSLYTFSLGTYTDEVTYESFTVTVSYVVNGEEESISYTYKLAIVDTTECRLVNGGFENGLEGWTQVGNIGGASSDTHYWVNDPEVAEGYEFGMDGNMMFSAYAPGALESAVGTLTSSSFTVGGSGFVTFKVGAMKDGNYVYVDVVDASTKQILARYYNGLWAERTDDAKSGCTLIAYKADLSAYIGREVFFRISDNADSGYGLFFADSFVTYYEAEPEGFNEATAVDYEISGTIYDLFNGGFELGDVQGWWNNGEIGVVTNATGYWNENIPYGKDGEYLYTGVQSFGADTMREGNVGALTSSVFQLGGSGYISFMLGGGGNQLCYVQVIDAVTGEVLARYHQQAMQDAVLVQYVADLSAYVGRTVRIQVVDYAVNNWGCVSFDNVVTYYADEAELPEGIAAIDIKDAVVNGSFETGNTDGWTMDITAGGDHKTLGWVLETEHEAEWYTQNTDRKDGSFLFTFVQPGDVNCENSCGTLNSSVFTLQKDSYVSFKFGAAGRREVNIQLCKANGEVIATFYNEAPGKVNTEMYAYYYQYTGETADCYFRIVDNADAGPYGCIVVDDFRVNLESAPEDYIEAIQ